MPHQCLGCGQSFAQGSTQLLKGCPGCGGTRFFFSHAALGEAERARLKTEQSADVKHVLAMLLAENADASPAEVLRSKSWDEWVSVAKPKRTEQATLDAIPDAPAAPSPPPAPAALPVPVAPAEPKKRESPGTVQVVAKGTYHIDVEALMDASPVVIEKDGVFMIHLPSVFETKRGR